MSVSTLPGRVEARLPTWTRDVTHGETQALTAMFALSLADLLLTLHGIVTEVAKEAHPVANAAIGEFGIAVLIPLKLSVLLVTLGVWAWAVREDIPPAWREWALAPTGCLYAFIVIRNVGVLLTGL